MVVRSAGWLWPIPDWPTRDPEIVSFFAKRGYASFYAAHNWPEQSRRIARLLKSVCGIVCNSRGTEAAVKAVMRVPTCVVYNATDPNPYVGLDKHVLRKELGLPEDAHIALYAGHLYGWKGADTLIGAARTAPTISFVIIGGTVEHVAAARLRSRTIPNLSFLGHQPKALVPKYLAAADVLLLPNVASTTESARYTSPLKLFEYMASGVPIVASDLPSLREILSEETADLVPPGDVSALGRAIQQVFVRPRESTQRSAAALQNASRFTWERHARDIADFMNR
jgi:glycosyltransferase involved in cell wall biosynthesis